MQPLRLISNFLIAFPFLVLLLGAKVSGINEGTYMELEVLKDKDGLPNAYQAYIKTPVCESDNCYIVQINFTWDLLGRFQKFDTISGEGLTKLDHIPFTESDYQKLARLLEDANSPLANYTKEELVSDTRTSEIDGFTGATALEIKESVISGGVYSCYTLWHIAHGSVVDSLKSRTQAALDSALVEKIVRLQDQEMNYFLIERFSEQDYLQYLPQFLKTFAAGSGYYAKNAIEKMPSSALAQVSAQDFFAAEFENLNYFAQVALLKKLQLESLSPAMTQTLKKQLEDRNSTKNQLIRNLLGMEKEP